MVDIVYIVCALPQSSEFRVHIAQSILLQTSCKLLIPEQITQTIKHSKRLYKTEK